MYRLYKDNFGQYRVLAYGLDDSSKTIVLAGAMLGTQGEIKHVTGEAALVCECLSFYTEYTGIMYWDEWG